MKPKRIQRSRKKGWKKPLNTVYVGRGSKWANPLILIKDAIYIDSGYRRKILDKWIFYNLGDANELMDLFTKIANGYKFVDVDLLHWSNYFKNLDITELKGKNLMCWCSLDQLCHADILLQLANE